MRIVLIVTLAMIASPLLSQEATTVKLTAQNFKRRTIYHSPQTPGYTCWCGLWTMPDGSVMCCFTQATGPVEGWRAKAPSEVRRRLAWPPAGHGEGYDMTGLHLENVHLRSADGGKNWERVSSDPFSSCMNGCTGQGEVALSDGTILRVVWGQYLPYWAVPQTGYCQRSTDGTKTWGPPELLMEDRSVQTWPKRLRRLSDGRLLVTGATVACDLANWTRNQAGRTMRPCIWLSKDKEGRQWSEPLYVVPDLPGHWTEEFDVAELENGDLLAVYRTNVPSRQQNLLVRKGDLWELTPVVDAPFPHSGHPELLAAKEGVVLHIATSGTSWTADGGKTWASVEGVPGSGYYPRSVQLNGGTVMVVGHVGGDNAYGAVDQSIVMDTYTISVERNKDQ